MKIIHGGDIYRNHIRLDFSVNTNPFGCPEAVRQALMEAADRAGVYPDPAQARVREALAGLHGISPEEVIAGNGASELILSVVNAVRPKRVLLTAPSFYGYERAVSGIPGCEVRWHWLREEDGFALTERFLSELTPDMDLCFLCNPNNPTGQTVDPDLFTKIIECSEEADITLVVDECFLELSSRGTSAVPLIREFEKLYVLKAFTKLLAVPGVRLGYVISARENTEYLRTVLPEWNLSVFAEAAAITGCRVLKDGSYIGDTLSLLEKERSYLTDALEGLSLRVYPGSANFLLIHTEKELYRLLMKQGILIRDCGNFPGLEKGYYRIAIRDHAANAELIRVLREVLD